MAIKDLVFPAPTEANDSPLSDVIQTNGASYANMH